MVFGLGGRRSCQRDLLLASVVGLGFPTIGFKGNDVTGWKSSTARLPIVTSGSRPEMVANSGKGGNMTIWITA
jgi:hypothetical protein